MLARELACEEPADVLAGAEAEDERRLDAAEERELAEDRTDDALERTENALERAEDPG